MVDVLRTGSNALLSIQQAISTTGHNIANVNTEGYSRQSINFTTGGSQEYGFGFVGQGSSIQSIERAHNDFLTSQVQDFSSNQSRYNAFVEFSSRVDNILANSENSLNTSLQKFFSAVSDVAANPSTLPERQVFIGEANNLVDRQQNFSHLLQDLNNEVNIGLRLAVTEVNGLSDSIADLNKQIVSATSTANGAAPNDLLDQRDMLIRKLSEKISVTTVSQDDGSLNVFVGKGQALVIAGNSTHLQTQKNPYDSSRIEIGIAGQVNVNGFSEFVSGGEIEGLLDFRKRVLSHAETKLGLVVLGLSETVNQQNQVGMDLNGNLGNSLFSVGNITAAGHISNVGTAVPNITLTDVSEVRPSDYRLDYDGAQWQLTRVADNTSVTGAGPLILDGLSVDVGTGLPAAGDSFIFNPGRTAAANFNLSVSDPRKIAAASPVITESSLTNSGLAEISDLNVEQINTLPLASDISLSFNPNALGAGIPGFDVVGGPVATLAYNPTTEGAGKTFTLPGLGLSFSVSGVPETGDDFVISNNAGGLGDNRNILKMGELQHQTVLNGSNDTFQDFYGSMVAEVGVTHRQGTSNLSVETALLEQAVAYRESVSGVNLDEEAANLLRYQQSYQAAARLVSVADEMFQTLLSSIR